ncbi:hypothetical protein EDB19DRAFT_881974 [Suillus lakei]|nr:hypothetical protein EDB19DRAFT_881974 [Suillus lakei]
MLRDMPAHLSLIFNEDGPKLVIASDEAHPLNKMLSAGFRPSNIICSIINAYSRDNDTSNWVAFLSTTLQVVNLPAPQVIHDSLRVAVAGQLLYSPYCHLGWDQNADPLSGISAGDVAKFYHIVGFGRPLWKTFVGNQTINEIMTLAARMLCNSERFDPTDMNQVLAVLSQRFDLDMCIGYSGVASYLKNGMASHLRMCFSITEDRAWAFTGDPSEPLLSCVAAVLLHWMPTSLTNALQVLKRKVDGGMVEIGQSGELASRLLLLLAKDIYVRSYLSEGMIQDLHYNGSGDAELIDCQKVSVVDFLEYLFGKMFWSRTVEEAKTAFQHAYINFSHWVSMSEFISPQVSAQPGIESLCAKE